MIVQELHQHLSEATLGIHPCAFETASQHITSQQHHASPPTSRHVHLYRKLAREALKMAEQLLDQARDIFEGQIVRARRSMSVPATATNQDL